MPRRASTLPRPTLTAGLPTLAALKLLEPTQLPGARAHPAPLLAAWELRVTTGPPAPLKCRGEAAGSGQQPTQALGTPHRRPCAHHLGCPGV